MNANLRKLPLDERIRLVEDLWDSIAADQSPLPLTPEQRIELDRRLDAYETDRDAGRPAEDVIANIRRRLRIEMSGSGTRRIEISHQLHRNTNSSERDSGTNFWMMHFHRSSASRNSH